jgi:hypothetical protein
VEPYRERIEDFIRRWRSRYEGNRVFRVLAVAVAVLLALLVLRRLRVLAVPVLIGAILVAGWLLVGPLLTIPRFSTEGPVVRNGVAAVMVCGQEHPLKVMGPAMKYVPEPGTGGWWPVRKGECVVWYHRPPGLEQRLARHERAAGTQPSADRSEFASACGFKVRADLINVRGMRKDCGIFGPQAAGTSGD